MTKQKKLRPWAIDKTLPARSYDEMAWQRVAKWVIENLELIKKHGYLKAQYVASEGSDTLSQELREEGWTVLRGLRPNRHQIKEVARCWRLDV